MIRIVSYYVVLVLESVLGVFPSYQIIARLNNGIEIRRYPPRLAAEVDQPRDGHGEADRAFILLFAYITGANKTDDDVGAKIAMTAPVAVHASRKIATTAPVLRSETDERLRMRFFMPSVLTQTTAPKPNDQRVKLVTVPVETVAILRFAGAPDSDHAHETELMRALATSDWEPAGEPYMLFYDPPFTIPGLRRNEAAVEVEKRH
jgi:hypothetical protein